MYIAFLKYPKHLLPKRKNTKKRIDTTQKGNKLLIYSLLYLVSYIIRYTRQIRLIFYDLWLCGLLILDDRWQFPSGCEIRVCFFSSGWKVEMSVS